jgi:GTPase SAR1 family protein
MAVLAPYQKTECHRLKAILLGEAGVGKSEFAARLKDEHSLGSTVGVDFVGTAHEFTENGVTVTAKVNIWDTAGQERFRVITRSYIRNVQMFFFVCDLAKRPTVDRIQPWVKYASDIIGATLLPTAEAPSSSTDPTTSHAVKRGYESYEKAYSGSRVVVVGNKSDLRSKSDLAADEKYLKEIITRLHEDNRVPDISCIILSARESKQELMLQLITDTIKAFMKRWPGEWAGTKEIRELDTSNYASLAAVTYNSTTKNYQTASCCNRV